MLILGFWFLQQVLFGYFDLVGPGGAAAASRTSPTSAASSSGCSRSGCSPTSASGAGSCRPAACGPERPCATAVLVHGARLHRPARLPDAVRAVLERARRARGRRRCWCSACSGAACSAPLGTRRDALPAPPGRPQATAVLAAAARAARGRAGAVAAAVFALPRPRRAGARAPGRRAPAHARRGGTDRSAAPLGGGGTAPTPLAVRLEDPRDSRARALQAPAALGPALRPRHGPRAVAARPDARAADRVADEDDDRAASSPTGCRAARASGSPRRRCTTRARASGCCRAASGSASRRCSTACCCRRATTRRSRLAQRAAGGSVRRFVALMNARARAHGPDAARATRRRAASSTRGNHSCAGDLAALGAGGAARAAAGADRRAARRPCCPSRSRAASSTSTTTTRSCGTGYRGTTGLKTGYTEAAGRCLVATARRGTVRLGVVLLHSPDPGRQAMRLLDRGLRAPAAELAGGPNAVRAVRWR